MSFHLFESVEELAQGEEEVFVADEDGVGGEELSWREVPDDADAGVDEAVGGGLGGVGGYGEDGELDVGLAEDGFELFEGLDDVATDDEADFCRVVVEEGDDVEAVVCKAGVGADSAAEASCADDDGGVVFGDAEGSLDGVADFGGVEADVAVAFDAEEGEVFSDEGGVEGEGLGELGAGDFGVVGEVEVFGDAVVVLHEAVEGVAVDRCVERPGHGFVPEQWLGESAGGGAFRGCGFEGAVTSRLCAAFSTAKVWHEW